MSLSYMKVDSQNYSSIFDEHRKFIPSFIYPLSILYFSFIYSSLIVAETFEKFLKHSIVLKLIKTLKIGRKRFTFAIH